MVNLGSLPACKTISPPKSILSLAESIVKFVVFKLNSLELNSKPLDEPLINDVALPKKKLGVRISTDEPLAVKFLVVIDKSSSELLILFVALPKKNDGVCTLTLLPLMSTFVECISISLFFNFI